jgi:hypothetical protein
VLRYMYIAAVVFTLLTWHVSTFFILTVMLSRHIDYVQSQPISSDSIWLWNVTVKFIPKDGSSTYRFFVYKSRRDTMKKFDIVGFIETGLWNEKRVFVKNTHFE